MDKQIVMQGNGWIAYSHYCAPAKKAPRLEIGLWQVLLVLMIGPMLWMFAPGWFVDVCIWSVIIEVLRHCGWQFNERSILEVMGYASTNV